MCDERQALGPTNGRGSGEQDGGEGEGERGSELAEVLNKLLAGSAVTRTLEQHVLNGVDWDRGGWVDRRAAGGVSAEGVDGVSAGFVKAGQHLTRPRTVEEQACTALSLDRGVVEEVERQAR